MKEQYIKQIKKEFGLYLSRKKRNEIIRDINEIFCSALEHGETEQQVIERLGAPTTQLGKAPDNAIGAADAMTNIRIEGAFGINVAQIMLVVGLIATLIAIIQIVRIVRNNRR